MNNCDKIVFKILFAFLSTILLFGSITPSSAQTTWYKYPGNPIFLPGESGEWDETIGVPVIIYNENEYQMWYVGKNSTSSPGIGYATSADGIHWERYEGNPLEFKCEGDSWDTGLGYFDILQIDSMYYMWYHGYPKENWFTSYIGFAWSADGLNWTKLPEPVLKTGIEDDWDELVIVAPNVIYDYYPAANKSIGHQKKYYMWYTGAANKIPITRRVGYATSDDGIHWEKYANNPVLDVGEPNSWENRWVVAKTVIYNGSKYEMWYRGFNDAIHNIGYATSTDGINWNKYLGNPVLRTGELGSWDDWFVVAPEVIKQDLVYKLWYTASNNTFQGGWERYGYATTCAEEATMWDTARINIYKRDVRVKVLNRTEYIKLDSLLQILPELSGTDLIDAYNRLALAYSLNDEKRSFAFAEKALELAEKTKYPEGKAMALYSIGNCYYGLDNYADALFYQLSALRLYDSLDLKSDVGNLLSQIASIHSSTGLHELASKYFGQSLEVFKELKDTASILQILDYLGNSYLESGDTSKAIKKFSKRLLLAKENNDIWKEAFALRSLGICFISHTLDSSIYYLNESQKIWDSIYWIEKGINYLITGESYFSFGPEYYKEAEEYFLKCYEIFRFEGGDYKIRLTYGMAELYLITGRHDKVKDLLDVSLDMCRSYLAKQYHENYESLSDKMESEIYLKSWTEKVYRLYFRFDTTLQENIYAWKHLSLANQWKDSIYNQQNRRQWAMLQGQYETESAERHIDVLEKENEVKDLKIQQSRIYLFALGGFVLIIILIALLFVRQNKIRAEHNTVILEQKLLRLQMNPHFIFNAFSNILRLIDTNENKKASEYLTTFGKLLRTTLESTREDMVPFEKEIDTLRNYLELQKLRHEEKFEYLLEVDKKIDQEDMSIPPMLVQPFIENAIEHGIRHKKTIGRIDVRFELKDKKIICEVDDDGVGREKAWEAEYAERGDHKSLATEIITDRIKVLNKKFNQKIRLKIIDKRSETKEAIGTKVLIDMPYGSVY